jgi:hypothetical protein
MPTNYISTIIDDLHRLFRVRKIFPLKGLEDLDHLENNQGPAEKLSTG